MEQGRGIESIFRGVARGMPLVRGFGRRGADSGGGSLRLAFFQFQN